MFSRLLRIASLAAVVAGSGLPAVASVVTEADGQFSRHWKSPTEIGFGAESILGTAEKQNGHEFVVLTALSSGAQTLTFEFTAPDWALTSDSYSAGGQILWSAEPFRHAWDGSSVGELQLSRWSPSQRLELSLGEDFAAPLYLGIYFSHGRDVAWSLSAPDNAPGAVVAAPAPSPVPLPAGVWSMLGGLSLLAAFARRDHLENGAGRT